MDANALMFSLHAHDVYLEAVQSYLASAPENVARYEGRSRAWSRVYARLRPSSGSLGPNEAEEILRGWDRELEAEMRHACVGVSSADLFFALRLLRPGTLPPLPFDAAKGDTIGAMAVRRVATYGAQLYGGGVPGDYSAPYGGAMSAGARGRFGRAFVELLRLSRESLYLLRFWILHGLGYALEASADGMEWVDSGEGDWPLFESYDWRRNVMQTPFTRSGEFFPEAYGARLWDPYEGPAADRLGGEPGLFSAVYMVDNEGRPSYRLCAWPFGLLERFLDTLDPDLVREAWGGLAKEGFLALLAGVCMSIKDALSDPYQLHAAHESAVVPFLADGIAGEPLLARARGYARSRGIDPADFDFGAASRRFFELALPPAQGSSDRPVMRTRLQDPNVLDLRYSELLRRFGEVCVADLFHADHWLHGPMDLLAEAMKGGTEGTEKGDRAEDQVCDYMGEAPGLTVVSALRKPNVKRIMHEGVDLGDLDCPVRLGSTLVVAEVKAYALDYAIDSVERAALQGRWRENQCFLDRVDRKARAIARDHKGKHYDKHLKGIRRVLPVVCRPYPEWVPAMERRYWLASPTQAEPGIPRVLTPKELRDLLQNGGEEGLTSLAGEHLIAVS